MIEQHMYNQTMEKTSSLMYKIADLLLTHKLYLVTAESCTGGLLGHLITNIPGSSGYYMGGQIAYSNLAKMRWLNVKQETLAKYGAVSRETVLEMAQGIRRAFAGDGDAIKIISLSISGIAGPSGGSEDKPVGMVWVGLSSPWGDEANEFRFDGDRLAIKAQSADKALEMLMATLTAHLEA
jgi:nicotinamide-nucleotide amidase